METRRLLTCGADLLDDCVAVLSLDDPLVSRVFVFVTSHKNEPTRVCAHLLVLLHAEPYRFEAARVGALAKERHSILRLKPMRVSSALQPFV